MSEAMQETTQEQEQVSPVTEQEQQEYLAKWEAFKGDVLKLAQEHSLAGVMFTAVYIKAGEGGRIEAVPTYCTAAMPSVSSPAFLYSLRDTVLGLTKNAANEGIEAALKLAERAQTQATQAPAEA